MSSKTDIDYLDRSWNPVAMRCNKVSPGCDNCWHLRMAHRHAQNHTLPQQVRKARSGGPVWLNERELAAPLRWKKPARIGVQFMGDLFHDYITDEMRDKVFAVMAACKQHTFFVLTKRPERMLEYVQGFGETENIAGDTGGYRLGAAAASLLGEVRSFRIEQFVADCHCDSSGMGNEKYEPRPVLWPLPNVWFGVSVENQQAADERIPLLLQTPAVRRWLSLEPMLGPVDLFPQKCRYCGHLEKEHDKKSRIWGCQHGDGSEDNPICGCRKLRGEPFHDGSGRYTRESHGIDWCVVGGESGPGARPMHPQWVRSLRDQCKYADVPFFFKSWGAWEPYGDAERQVLENGALVRYPADPDMMVKSHEKNHLIDGQEHRAMPGGAE